METYVHSHQDKSRNALNKALEASLLAWHEELRADQAQFESEKDCHNRAWECVSNFIAENLTQFAGKTVEAESTVMPASRAWLRDQANALGNSPEDHAVILFLNCPAIGVISAARHSFILNYITNVLADFPLNSVCFVVHPNRAQQEGRRGGAGANTISLQKNAVKKEEDEDEDMEPKGKVKCDEDEEESEEEPATKSKKDEHEDLVRKVRTETEEVKTEPPAKRIKLETLTEQEVSKMPNVLLGGMLSARLKRSILEASEVVNDAEGRWISFSAHKETMMLLEKKGLSEHLQKLECVDTVVTLQSLVCDLQDAGEAPVKLEVSHHKQSDDTSLEWVSSKPLVFVLDECQEIATKKKGKKGKKDGVQISNKNFGSWMSITKIKTAMDTLKVGWRCRSPVFK
eukprot:s599_g20.t1